jgi:hypothetical protein
MALWSEFGHKGLLGLLPDDLREALREIHRLNSLRNQRIMNQTAEIVGRLNDLGIEPLLLKGAAFLCGDLFLDRGSRFLSDIDILIPPDRLASAVEGLDALGYRTLPRPDVFLCRFTPKVIPQHHLPAMGRPEDEAILEVHATLCPPAELNLVGIEEAWNAAERVEVEGLRFQVLSATHTVLHNLQHSEINHGCYLRGGDTV